MTEAEFDPGELKSFLAVCPELFCVTESGRFLYLNSEWSKILGYSLDVLRSKPGIEWVHPEDRERTLKRFQNIDGNTIRDFRNRLLRSDGASVWVSWSATGSEKGKIFAIGRDITDEKEQSEELAKTLKYLKDLEYAIDQAAIVSTTDPDGNIVRANDLMAKVTKYSKEELIGKNHRLTNSGYHSKEFFAELWRTVRSGKVWRGEIRNRAKDGSLYWAETTIVPFLDEKHHPYQYMAIRKDITAKKFAQAQLEEERAKRQYASRLAAVGEMSASIAHEINNPLTAIASGAHLLKKLLAKSNGTELDRAALMRVQRTIAATTDRIGQIVQGLKTFSRDGSIDPIEPVPLSRILQDTLEFCHGRLLDKRIRLEIEGISDEIRIECRPVQVSQILLNLINNAADAISDSIVPERWIKVSVNLESQGVAISVSDSGPGIPPEIRARIMEPFFTTKPVNKGTGLGLSISKSLAESQKGYLRLLDGVPHTTFVLWLPRAISRDQGASNSMTQPPGVAR